MNKKSFYGITAPRIEAVSAYKFRIGGLGRNRVITIRHGSEEKGYSVSILRFMVNNTGLDEATRAMARQALQTFGLLDEPKEDEIPEGSETVLTIAGVKVYQDLGRRFFAIVRGRKVVSQYPSVIEKEIRGK